MRPWPSAMRRGLSATPRERARRRAAPGDEGSLPPPTTRTPGSPPAWRVRAIAAGAVALPLLTLAVLTIFDI